MTQLGEHVIGVLTIQADEISEELRSRIPVMPEGEYVHPQAGKMTITREHLEQLAAQINASGDTIPLDYDHSFGKGQGSLAAGWFIRGSASVDVGEDGLARLHADVQWTPRAASQIRSGEYRFISPEWNFRWKDRVTGKIVKGARLFAAALTNRPFFDNLGPVHLCDEGLDGLLASDEDDPTDGGDAEKEETMDTKAIAEALGLAADADQEAVLAAIAAAKVKESADDKPAFDEASLAALVADAAKGKEAANELSKMRRDSAIEAAIRERKIAPAQKEHFEALWASNAEGTERLLASIEAGSWEPIGSEGKGATEGTTLAQPGNHSSLYGHNPPASVAANGDVFEVSKESRDLHVEALKLLEAESKLTSYTADDYVRAVEAAASKQGIAL